MPEQLPQNVSRLVFSLLGAIGHQDHAEGLVLFGGTTF